MSWRLGPYRVDERPFASGATAEVFAARRGRTGPRVALKVLPLRTYRERAATEAATSTIDHPRLLAIHEAVVDERRGVVGLVMDLADEGDLRTALRGVDAPSPVEMLRVTDDVLAALAALHGAGIVHRDIKPENVMLERIDGELRARLGDLGIARPIDRTRSTGSVLGTDLYIAPEVHDGAAPSAAADLWAVGYVLYEGLFGAPPHSDAATTYQAIGRLRVEGPNRPPHVPDAMWAVVATLLACSPQDRPVSAVAARALLSSARPAAIAASVTHARGIELVRPGARLRSTGRRGGGIRRPVYERSPAVTRSVAALAAAVVVLGGVAWAGSSGQLRLFGDGAPTLGAISSVTPLAAESGAVVPTQYHWRLHAGVLTGRLDVTNPSEAATEATSMPELFPSSTANDGSLSLVGYNGAIEPQKDGSVLVRFAVPPLAPRAHHVVSFRLTLAKDANDNVALARLVRDREAAINRHAFALSDTPILDHFSVSLTAANLNVGQSVGIVVHGFTREGSSAPASLLRDVRFEMVSGLNSARVDGQSVVGTGPGDAVLRAVIGDLHADSTFSVKALPAAPTTTVVKKQPVPKHSPTTETTIESTPITGPDESFVV